MKKGTNLNIKVRKSNKRYETQIKGTKLEEHVQNVNENMRNYETKRFYRFAKQLETLYFVFCETIETRRNSDLFRTVSYFAKLKKRNCQP